MATGMAIMGFGGGAFIGSNFSLLLMDHFKSAPTRALADVGNRPDLFLLHDFRLAHRPRSGGRLEAGRLYSVDAPVGVDHHEQRYGRPGVAHAGVLVFGVVLCFNVTAGIGIWE